MKFYKADSKAYFEFSLKIFALVVTLYFLFSYSYDKHELNPLLSIIIIGSVTILLAICFHCFKKKKFTF